MTIRTKLTPEEAKKLLDTLPGPRKFWLWLADRLIKAYEKGK